MEIFAICFPQKVNISGVKNIKSNPISLYGLVLGQPTPGGGSLAQRRALRDRPDPTQQFRKRVKYLSADIFGSDFFFSSLYLNDLFLALPAQRFSRKMRPCILVFFLT